jgi:predicted aldo/keto reductase-like oxidoreductase
MKRSIHTASQLPRSAAFGKLGEVCRLGLATRTGNDLTADDVFDAIEQGVNYLNWPGAADGLSAAVAQMTSRQREAVFVAVQLAARTATSAHRELDETLAALGTDYVDVVTYYYVERRAEWERITRSGGAADVIERAREQGTVRMIGLTSHQRRLAASLATNGRLEMLMLRYNAAHRGAEQDVFPVTDQLNMPVVTYTGLRWRALMRPTPDDPPGFTPPPAPQWYRFVLSNPSVRVGLMAPHDRAQLKENLRLLDDWRSLSEEEFAALADHGRRVRKHAGSFP